MCVVLLLLQAIHRDLQKVFLAKSDTGRPFSGCMFVLVALTLKRSRHFPWYLASAATKSEDDNTRRSTARASSSSICWHLRRITSRNSLYSLRCTSARSGCFGSISVSPQGCVQKKQLLFDSKSETDLRVVFFDFFAVFSFTFSALLFLRLFAASLWHFLWIFSKVDGKRSSLEN